MKILLINYEYPPIGAGAANATRHLGLAFRDLGHDVTVLSAAFEDKHGRSVEDGLHVIRLPAFRRHADRASLGEMAVYVAAAGWFLLTQKIAADCAIVFFSIPCGPLGLLAKSWRRIPYVISLRGGDVPGAEVSIGAIHRLLAPLRRAVLRSSLGVVANSEGLAALSRNTDPFPVEIIPNGVDADYFAPASDRAAAQETRSLFVGRFQEQKNLPFLLEVFAEMAAGDHAQKLILVGDGPLRALLEDQARRLGLSDQIEWKGWLGKDDLRREYRRADVQVNLSLYEGMPNVLLEAMASGLPVLASDGPGHEGLVRQGQTGFLCALQDRNAIVRTWRRLATDPTLRKSLGNAASLDVRNRFTWKNAAQSYLRLIETYKP